MSGSEMIGLGSSSNEARLHPLEAPFFLPPSFHTSGPAKGEPWASCEATTKDIFLSSLHPPMSRKPRIALDPPALHALKVWAALEDQDPGSLISDLILNHMPARVREVLGDFAPRGQEERGTGGKLPPEESKIPKRGHRDNKRLEEYPDLCITVDRLLAQVPRPTYAEIGRRVGRSRFAIRDYEKRKMA